MAVIIGVDLFTGQLDIPFGSKTSMLYTQMITDVLNSWTEPSLPGRE